MWLLFLNIVVIIMSVKNHIYMGHAWDHVTLVSKRTHSKVPLLTIQYIITVKYKFKHLLGNIFYGNSRYGI